MKILIGCEESQTVCKAFRALGHEAYSCDLLPCSGGHPEWHIQYDVLRIIKGGNLVLANGSIVNIDKWDIGIFHPPCTYTALCGNRWYYNSPLRNEGIEFCKSVWERAYENIDKIALEQPKTIMQKYIGKRSKTIHPWQYGHGETKETWLWLKNLPDLIPTGIVDGRENKIWLMSPSADRGKLRSKTYNGIAKAMAQQWGGLVK